MSKFLLPEQIEEQESLTLENLKKITFVKDKISEDILKNRPGASFIELLNWTLNSFKHHLKDQKINKFVNNRIIIDGQFLQFANENKITIECLLHDSVVSWESNYSYEKYFAQGVFLISYKDMKFIHAALYHKGNQNEDEISFFILVSDKNYDKYVDLRNKFDQWISDRDRDNLFIRVVDGEDIPYQKDLKWDDLFLPKPLKNEIKKIIENFLSSQQFYIDSKIPWKRGIILYGNPGNGKTSIIRTIISEYNFKPITVVPGASIDAIREAFNYAEESSPSLLYFEDLDSLVENGLDVSSFLNLLDGISTKNGLLVIATANEIGKLKSNITQRPSRFDRKFEIPLPDHEMSLSYMEKWFGKFINKNNLKNLSKYTEKYKFSYAYLKELYISSIFEALSNNRKVPLMKDIDVTLKKLVKEKNLLASNNVINTDKYFE